MSIKFNLGPGPILEALLQVVDEDLACMFRANSDCVIVATETYRGKWLLASNILHLLARFNIIEENATV